MFVDARRRNRLRHDVFVERETILPSSPRLTSASNPVPLAVILRRMEFAPRISDRYTLQRRHIPAADDAPLRSGNAGQRQFA